MISRKYETIVGIFVLASLGALLVMVLIIAQQEYLWQERVEYQAIFKNISGLKTGSEVRLSGVTVGNVKELTIGPTGNVLVSFDVLGKFRDQIRQDSQASIGMQGLLGDKSLDITPGSPDKPPMPPEGLLAVVEPMDFTVMLSKAGPALEDLQRTLSNLAKITHELADPGSETSKTLDEIGAIVKKINEGKGTIGMLVNDPTLYREVTQTATDARQAMAALSDVKGLVGAMLHDQAFRERVVKAIGDIQGTFGHLREATALLPAMFKKGDTFLDNLNRAGKGLPELVQSGQGLVGDADKVAKAAQKSFLLRGNIPPVKEHTIRVERETGAGSK